MSSEQWVISAVAVAATVAVVAVVLLAVQLRRVRAQIRDLEREDRPVPHAGGAPPLSPGPDSTEETEVAADPLPVPVLTDLPETRAAGAAVRNGSPVVTSEGRTIVLPTSDQVVHATLGRPMVRGAVLSHGIWFALRAENRDRVRALVRREYRRRRRTRQRAGRRAARRAPVSAVDAQAWLGSRTHAPGEREGAVR